MTSANLLATNCICLKPAFLQFSVIGSDRPKVWSRARYRAKVHKRIGAQEYQPQSQKVGKPNNS